MIGQEIFNQLGGNKFTAMTGAKYFLQIENGLRFGLPRGAKNKANRIEITLNCNDLYDMSFIKYTPDRLDRKTFEWKPGKTILIKEYKDIYCDQLTEIFETETGLYTRLF